jgi:CTP:molybdopterin cytidylyltransferase MocA
MGRSKALLPLEGSCFLEILVGRLKAAGADPILVILGADQAAIRRAVDLSAIRVVENPDPGRGPLSSIHCGLAALAPGEVAGLFIAPVDVPRVAAGTLRRMVASLPGRPLVVPTYRGRRGHPALFSAVLFDALRRAPLDAGARAVVHATADRLELPVEDPAVVEDFDRPEDLAGV